MLRHTTIVFFLTVSLAAVPAQAETAEKEALTRTLVKRSGLEQQIRLIPLIIASELEGKKAQVHPALDKLLRKVLGDAYQAEKLERSVHERVARNLDVKTMRHALRWFQSGLGKKIARLEEKASTPRALRKMQEFANRLQANPPTRRRLELAERFNTASNATEISVSLAEATAMGLAWGLNAIQPKDRRVGQNRLRKQLELQRPELMQALRQMTTVSFLYTYHTLSDAQLERYVQFAESKVGRTYHKVTGAALRDALMDAANRAGKALARAMKQFPRNKAVKVM